MSQANGPGPVWIDSCAGRRRRSGGEEEEEEEEGGSLMEHSPLMDQVPIRCGSSKREMCMSDRFFYMTMSVSVIIKL